MGEIDAGRLVLRAVDADAARALLQGRRPEGVVFAPGRPTASGTLQVNS